MTPDLNTINPKPQQQQQHGGVQAYVHDDSHSGKKEHDASSRSGSSSNNGSSRSLSLDALEFAVSLTQHHDAVTGTEKQAVANDYAR